MNQDLYPMIFKRKSFHTYMNTGNQSLSEDELKDIYAVYKTLKPLYEDIKTEIDIKKEKDSSCHRGNEYTIYFFSEIKDNYLANIGYIVEQLDLYLASKNIGCLWFGIGKTDERYHDLDFVIMMGIKKVPEDKFRKDMFKSKRKDLSEIWQSDDLQEIGNIVRFTPSACNSQPWLVKKQDNSLFVYRYKKEGKRGIMPKNMVFYYNRIDIGIFICFLELCLEHNSIQFERQLFIDDKDEEYNLLAKYILL